MEAIAGTYHGEGRWYDSAGQSGAYHVSQTNRVLTDGVEIAYHHAFDDGSVIDARLTLNTLAPQLYRVLMAGTAVGHGSWLDETLHYHLELGGKFVEVGYRVHEGELRVSGSSSRNAAGNYIAWVERLRRVATT